MTTGPRTLRYQAIATDLRERVLGAEFVAGSLLPSESDLSHHYGASRVTIRRALETLRAEALVDARQGVGWFVAADPVRHRLEHLGTLEDQLADSGVDSERRVLEFGFVMAPEPVAEDLGTGRVLEVRRLHLADGQPLALVTVWCREDVAAEMSRADVERASFLDQLPVRIAAATQTIGAGVADEDAAEHLSVPVGSALLVAERLTRDDRGATVLSSRHVFPAHRMEYVVELTPDGDRSLSDGLRLVE